MEQWTSPSIPICFVCLVNRYGSGDTTIAVYRDFGLDHGALASTVSHDSHNLTVAYKDPEDALKATKALQACGGGSGRSIRGTAWMYWSFP